MPLSEAMRHLVKARKAHARIQTAHDAAELRDAWEDFLASFARSLGRLIDLGNGDERSRVWAHRLRNASQRDDEGLVYLREARNVAEHGLKPFGRFIPTHVDFGIFGRFAGDARVSISDCVVNGVPIHAAVLQVQSGRVEAYMGPGEFRPRQHDHQLRLGPIENPEKRKRFSVPASVDGKVLRADDPSDLAEEALRCIERRYVELRWLLDERPV